MAPRVVKWRIYQDPICSVLRNSTLLERTQIFRVESDRFDPSVEVIESRVVDSERAQHRVDLNQRNLQFGMARRKGKPGSADTRPKINRKLAAARSCGRCEQNCVMTDTMTTQGLAQA